MVFFDFISCHNALDDDRSVVFVYRARKLFLVGEAQVAVFTVQSV